MSRGPSPYSTEQKLQMVAQWQTFIDQGQSIKEAFASLKHLTGVNNIAFNTISGWRRDFGRSGMLINPPYPTLADPRRNVPRQLAVRQLNAIDMMVRGQREVDTALAVGVARATINRWRNHNPQFAAELEKQRIRLLLRARMQGEYRAQLADPVAPEPSTVNTAEFVTAFVDRVTEFRETLAKQAAEITRLEEELSGFQKYKLRLEELQAENLALHNSIQRTAYKESNWNEQLAIIGKPLM